MKKMLNLELGLVICLLFSATIMTATGTTFENKVELIFENNELLGLDIIEVPDTDIVLTLWQQEIDYEILPFYSISLDGGQSTVRTVQADYELGLRYAYFDPIELTPEVDLPLASDEDTHLYIVQFLTQPLEEFKIDIENLGGLILHYIAQYAYLVEMEDEVISEVQNLPYVRWIGPYHPAYRLEEFMIDNFDNANEMYPIQRYNIQVHTVEQKQVLAEKIASIGGTLIKEDAGKVLVEATLTPEQLFEIVRFDEVLFVDRWSEYEADMDNGREIGGANYIETVAGYTGNDVRGESFDTGFNLNHIDFQHHPLIVHGGACGSDSHGTACAGILFGDGTGNPDARGLLPDGQGIVADYTVIGLEGSNRYTHTGELVEDPYYAVFQTASVGSGRTTQYTTVSADTDAAIFDFDVVLCQSQSNAGNQNSRPQAWAKNIVSGGAAYHYDTLTKDDDCWCYGASIGPASDGRIKPTFCFFYDDILTVGWPGNNQYTEGFGGTSGATPMTAGHVGLFFEMWDDGIFGNEVDPLGSVFENKAHVSTAKAALINTAEQYEFSGTSHDLTRMHQGWGMPNVQNLYDLRDDIYIIDETDIIQPFEVKEYILAVKPDQPELKVTLVYSDLPGNPSVQSQHRINDLTLKVISPAGDEYWGNNGLVSEMYSEPGGEADTKNTVECVFVKEPQPGPWIIEIHADEIIQDSHIETTDLDADFALVASPVSSGPYPPVISGPSSGDVGKDIDFQIVTEDPAELDVYYQVDWGDGTIDDWFGPYPSGEEITITHAYAENGSYQIKAIAENVYGTEGIWSEPLNITIYKPILVLGQTTGGLFYLNTVIKNIGEAEANDVAWEMTLHGNTILLGRFSSGVIPSIPPGGEFTVRSDLILGLGPTEVLIMADHPYGEQIFNWVDAKILLIYLTVES